MKPNFKAPGTKRLKLNCDILLSNYAFKIKLRRYSPVKHGRKLGFRKVSAGWQHSAGVTAAGRARC